MTTERLRIDPHRIWFVDSPGWFWGPCFRSICQKRKLSAWAEPAVYLPCTEGAAPCLSFPQGTVLWWMEGRIPCTHSRGGEQVKTTQLHAHRHKILHTCTHMLPPLTFVFSINLEIKRITSQMSPRVLPFITTTLIYLVYDTVFTLDTWNHSYTHTHTHRCMYTTDGPCYSWVSGSQLRTAIH